MWGIGALAVALSCAASRPAPDDPPADVAATHSSDSVEDAGMVKQQTPHLEMEAPPPPADGQPATLVLRSGRLQAPGLEVPGGFYVPGRMEHGGFVPDGTVEGGGELAAEGGQSGWLELSNGAFVPAQTSRPPFPPYVNGFLTAEGFVPSTRTVAR